ncbi:hypothetical protein A3A54_01435 [Candidatus Curtissbacteria bacterium RIFCSPLOWO2_01_FULL_39_62]|uniref:Ribbon-helix-helix protein CopG domain-containing protein n=1 Tax=Candidatus Curtissbacteria bacterium RIFCSPHIGHO2_02_FULL_40_16b TaxID=1797714 RepID=A0A1F5GC58_9BACT|nr:MAG: hypothetical protein A3D04_04530 [Candidatus Curtissbacteria bacterium RIFCSPHIGHO2_02_FULL_40_16b]OGE00897.1 MAG: hypothetical protein A3A54_01435 [Candidatus Curtissbacteria bacterium RIFCSPLOWO2_01_FULL_39_62]
MNTQTINISLPSELLKSADKLAKKESRTRSELIREALRAYVKELSAWEDLFEYGRKQAKKLGIKPKDIPRLIDEYRRGI